MSNKENDKIIDGLQDGTISPNSEQGQLLDRVGIIKEYMRELAMKSVASQKKTNPNKMSEMGKKAMEVRWGKKKEVFTLK